MSKIVDYIINMLPYMIISIPFIIVIRFIIIKSKKYKKINWYHEVGLFFFLLFLVGLSSQTFIPKFETGVTGSLGIRKGSISELNLIPFKVFIDTYKEVFVNGYINYFIINFLGNIIMFIPIGFFSSLLWKISNKKVIIMGLCFSIFIEFCQLFLSRGTDIDDLWLNTLGAFLGLLIFKVLNKRFNKQLKKFIQLS